MRRPKLSKEASEDLRGIRRYLEGNAGKSVARYVLQSLRDAIRLLGERPGIGHSREDLTDEPLKFWPVFSYLIIYDPAPRPIEIVRVVHGNRDVEQMLQ
jgi:antitoxin ParD1/3/4/toxin ParE1/3/4